MIIVRISIQALAEKQKEVMQTLLSLMVRLERETGCLSYALLSDIKDKNTLYVLEEWENRQKLDNHLKSDLFGVLLGIKSLLRQPHGIRIYTVEKAEGMNAVLAVRGKTNDSGTSKIKEIKP
ncbi:MAG: antibiotic biosynthesis monooxygenase [Desulfobacteraceae bacterium]|nr:antibiotic biosynthesis monooxygenase [Desulfobacteraceae bacterium]